MYTHRARVAVTASSLSALVAAVAATPLSAHQAEIQTVILRRPAAELPEPFSRVTGLAEFSDGRLAVTDPVERLVAVVDLASGTRRRVGRTGQGPNEYSRPFGVVRLPGDTMAVYDGANRRLFLVSPEGRPASTVALPERLVTSGGLGPPRGADADGYVYFEKIDLANLSDLGELPTMGSILRWRPRDGEIDSVTAVAVRDLHGRKVLRPFQLRDGWDVAPDGRVAVARGESYTIEWHGGGRPVMSGPVPYEPVPLDDEEIEAYWRAQRTAPRSTARSTDPDDQSSSSDAGGLRQLRREWEFPEHLPPFHADGIFVSPDGGELWVVRTRAWDAARPLVDVFDRDGRRIRQIVLPADTRLVGLGENAAYLARVDADDLQWLGRYPVTR